AQAEGEGAGPGPHRELVLEEMPRREQVIAPEGDEGPRLVGGELQGVALQAPEQAEAEGARLNLDGPGEVDEVRVVGVPLAAVVEVVVLEEVEGDRERGVEIPVEPGQAVGAPDRRRRRVRDEPGG